MIRIRVACVLGALVLSGCAQGQVDAGAENEPEVGTTGDVDSADDIALPMDAYAFTEREDRTLSRAYLLLVKRCGERFGVTITMPPPENPSPADVAARRYFIIDSSEADQWGFNRPPSGLPEGDKAAGGGWDPSDREYVVVTGQASDGAAEIRDESGSALPEDGCAGEAERVLGVPPAGAEDVMRLANAARERAETDSRVLAAFAAWSGCMKRSGYSYQSPREPNNFDWPEPPGSEEIATAKADVACKQETNLAGIWMAVEAAYQQRQIEEHAQELTKIKAWRDDRVRNATRALGDS